MDRSSFYSNRRMRWFLSFSFRSSIMSNKHERIREIKYHINQLLSELRRIEPNDSNLDKHRSFTQISSEPCFLDCHCPYLSRQLDIFHSTTYHDYKKLQQQQQQQHKEFSLSPKKNFLGFACATSTPKTSPNENHLLLKPYRTSTPRRYHQPSTNLIPLKRLLYNQYPSDKDTNRFRHSTKRPIIFPRSNPRPPSMDNHLQWI